MESNKEPASNGNGHVMALNEHQIERLFLRPLREQNEQVMELMRPVAREHAAIVQGLQIEIPSAELAALLERRATELEAQAHDVDEKASMVASLGPRLGLGSTSEMLRAKARSYQFTSKHLIPDKTYRLDQFVVEQLVGADPRALGPLC